VSRTTEYVRITITNKSYVCSEIDSKRINTPSLSLQQYSSLVFRISSSEAT